MRSVPRRLLDLLTLLSLLLSVAAVAVWVRSYWYYSKLGYTAAVDDRHLTSTTTP
jgi:hypothetical protein